MKGHLKAWFGLIFASFVMMAPSLSARSVQVEAGFLDLSQLSLSGDAVPLDGQWDFFWNQLIDPNSTELPDGQIHVPGEWNNFLQKGSPVGGIGYGSYRLRLKLPASVDKDDLALRLGMIGTSYRIFINGKDIGHAGWPSETESNSKAAFQPDVYRFQSDQNDITIVIHVANYEDKSGGLWSSPKIGSERELRNDKEWWLAFETLVVGAIFIMALYHFVLFYLRRLDRSTLMFGLTCLFLAVRGMLSGERSFGLLFPDAPFWIGQKLDYLTYYLAVPSVYHYFSLILPRDFSQILRKLLWFVFGVLSVVVIATPGTVFSHTLLFANLLLLLLMIYVLYAAVFSLIHKEDDAWVFLTGTLILVAAAANDMLYNFEIINTGYFISMGLFSYILFQSALISIRFAKAFTRVEVLTEELSAKNASLQQMDRLKDEFISNTSHELRTPLNGIIGLAESLNAGIAGTLSEIARENLSLIIVSGRRLLSLVNDLLDFSKLQSSELILQLKPLDLYSIVDLVLKLSKPLADANSVELVNNVDREITAVYADENRVQQILHNLIGNAIKFANHGKVVVAAKEVGSQIEVSVADNGVGIDPDKLSVIFRPFEQADGSIAREFGGTGIGLSITKSLVELHKGHIWVFSKPGEGSVFTFSLPKSTVNATVDHIDKIERVHLSFEITERSIAASSPQIASLNSSLPSNGSHIQVLAVDDEPINLKVVTNHLQLAGISVDTALSGTEALAKIRKNRPDVILMDVMMPKMNGYETTERIRSEFSQGEIPIVILTAKNQSEDMIRGFDCGANDYIAKPFDPRELIARVRTLLTLKSAIKAETNLQVLQNELRVANRIQLALIPEAPADLAGIEVACRYEAMDSVGGDFYDFLKKQDATGIIISDVSGHGVPAALIVSMLKVAFNMMYIIMDQPGLLLEQMNQMIEENLHGNFVTVTYAHIDRSGRLRLARGGHPPVYVYRRSTHQIVELMPKGPPLGTPLLNHFDEIELQLDQGDRLVFYTDGIIEAAASDLSEYGADRLKNTILKNIDLEINSFADAIIADVHSFCGANVRNQDDIALVVCDYTG